MVILLLRVIRPVDAVQFVTVSQGPFDRATHTPQRQLIYETQKAQACLGIRFDFIEVIGRTLVSAASVAEVLNLHSSGRNEAAPVDRLLLFA